MELLRIENLRTVYDLPGGRLAAVDGVSLSIGAGEAVGLVGESGCGKSATALSILRLIQPPGRIETGAVRYAVNGGPPRDLLQLSEAEMQGVRGAEIAMIFQEPLSAFNPVMSVGDQIMEGLRAHGRGSRREARDRAVAMLEAVAVPDAARRLRSYPHELSGGLRQRAMMAMALVCGPRLLIADEPTTAVDVTVQAQILELLKDLQRRFGLSLLLISHDLGVVASLAERVAVMYAGQIIELGPTQEVLSRPQHPYTAGLLRSLPGLEGPRRNRLATLPGTVPDLTQLPPGCRFEPRCSLRIPDCSAQGPSLREISPQHEARCIRSPLTAELPPAGAISRPEG